MIFLVKRAVTVLTVLFLMFAGVGVRIASIGAESEQAASPTASMSVDIADLRGTVYDCRMRPLTNAEYDTYAAAKPTSEAASVLKGGLSETVFQSVFERMSKQKPIVIKLEYPIASSDDVMEIKVPKRYSDSACACHIIGYLGSDGYGVSGIEKAFDQVLSDGAASVRAKFFSDAKGRVMLGEDIEIENGGAPKAGVALTLDYEIQRIAENALDGSGTECGAAVVIDIESGAIRACVSRPAFSPDAVAESLNDPLSPMINRAFLPFSVGSVFKPVVAAAAIEQGIDESFEYNCTGSVTHNGVTFNCHKREGHGVIDMRQAIADSCNTYFIELALKTGAESIIETAKSFGFGRETAFADGMKAAAGTLPSTSELDSKAAVANIAFGQGALLATRVQICSMMAAIARGGVYVKPYLVEGEVDSDGVLTPVRNYGEKKQIISVSTAMRLRSYLEAVVLRGSGKRAAGVIVSAAGKTATAQTGKSENGEEIYNAWFAGYFPAESPKYAVAVLKENGGEGAVSCAPVFREIAEKVTILYG